MDTIQTVSLAVIAASTLVLAVFVLVLLLGIWQGVRKANRILKEFKDEFGPVARDIKETALHANEVAERVVEEVEGLTGTVTGVRRRAERLGALVEVLEEDLENATIRTFSLLGGLGRVVSGAERRKRRRSKKEQSPEGVYEDE